tara:strand:- start:26 stop:736 length:711 start_codon:yes stop_codon:yes gene_type:complete
MLGQLCLVSTSGDMSSRGMGNHNTIYLFPYEYKKQVDNFLKAELNFSLHTYNENWLKKGSSKIPCKRYSESYHVLKDLNVFTCKYDFRTSWDMRFFDKIELEQFEPYVVHDNFNIIKNYEKRKEFKIKKLSKKTVCNWFGDRGYDLNSAKFNYKAIYDPNNDNDWIFINVMKANNYYTDESFDKKEVELFYLNTDIAEPYDSWKKKSFKWAKKNLISLIPKEDNDKWYEKFRIINT